MTITKISSNHTVLLDSDFLFGLIVSADPHHQDSTALLTQLVKQHATIECLNIVIQETATVLSNKRSHTIAKAYAKEIYNMPVSIIPIDRVLELKAWDIFHAQKKKGTSFIDCANLAYLEHKGLDAIASFDHFYPKKLRLEL